MFKKINKKGFTLAELLIVVAIIGVLVAISIPIFTAQLKKARLATNQANARAAYAAVVAGLLNADKSSGSGTYDVKKGALTGAVSDTATGGDITTTPNEWTVDSCPNEKLLSETATTWTVYINDAATNPGVTYSAGGLSS